MISEQKLVINIQSIHDSRSEKHQVVSLCLHYYVRSKIKGKCAKLLGRNVCPRDSLFLADTLDRQCSIT